MKIIDIYKQRTRPLFSLEIFPPKTTSGVETIYRTLDGLSELRPDFISVTYGAGGNAPKHSTVDIAASIRNDYNTESMAHLTAYHNTRAEVSDKLAALTERGVTNVLALRGDFPKDGVYSTDFAHASDLAAFIREHAPDMGIGGACYPECHPEAESLDRDIENMKRKVDAGVEFLVTQLFFDNDIFSRYVEKLRKAGVNVPILAGIMPITSAAQIQRIVAMCGTSVPQKLAHIVAASDADGGGGVGAVHSDTSLSHTGLVYAAERIRGLMSRGVDGIHLYTMNNAGNAKAIAEMIGGTA